MASAILNRCSFCRYTGHNKRTCPERERYEEGLRVEAALHAWFDRLEANDRAAAAVAAAAPVVEAAPAVAAAPVVEAAPAVEEDDEEEEDDDGDECCNCDKRGEHLTACADCGDLVCANCTVEPADGSKNETWCGNCER